MTLKEAVAKYPNDYDLGKFFFINYADLDDFNEFEGPKILREYPNHYDLGAYLRHKYLHIKK